MKELAMTYNKAELVALDKKHVWHHLTQHKVYENSDPAIYVKGEGMRITDIDGNTYIDAVSGGVWTVNVGYGRKEIVDAVAKQMLEMCYFANGIGNVPTIQFSKKLIEKMPGMSRVYLSNSGSEANEKAFKIVRQIGQLKHGGKKTGILYRSRDYHGTTIGTLSACGQFERRVQYGPFAPGFYEFPDCDVYRSKFGNGPDLGEKMANQLEEVILNIGPDELGGVIVEPMTAGGGILVPPAGYYETIRKICDKYDLLLIMDEVVCGLGRTGKWFGYQHFNVQPDIVTMAKGFRLRRHFVHGDHGKSLPGLHRRPGRPRRLLPRHFHLRRLHRRPRRGSGEHGHHRARKPARQLRQDGRPPAQRPQGPDGQARHHRRRARQGALRGH